MAGRLKSSLKSVLTGGSDHSENINAGRLRANSYSDFSNTSSSATTSARSPKRPWSRKVAIEPTEMSSIEAILQERVGMPAQAHPTPPHQLRLSGKGRVETPPDYDDLRNAVPVDLEDLHNARFAPWSPTRTPVYSRNNSEEQQISTPRQPFALVTNGAHAEQEFNAPLNFEGAVGLSGLSNLGNTCFMNAALQCLSATIPLSTHLRNGSYKADLNRHAKLGSAGYITRALARLFRVMWSQEHSHVSPLAVRDALWRFAPQFQGFEQQDSQEVLTFFLDQLHEDLNLVKVKPDSQLSDKEELALETMPPLLASQEEWERGLLRDNSVISRLFHGQESSRLRCLTCQATSTTWSSYNMLSLKIPAAKRKKGNAFTIEDLLRDYTKSEMMPEEEGWRCHKCQEPRAASHTLSITRLPPVLILHISRTVFNDYGLMDKDDRPISFPVSGLQLGQFLSPPAPGQNMVYDLYAMVNHVGSASAGHYTSLVQSQNQWIELNDKVVSQSTPKDVSKHFRSAYILCYKLRQ